MTSVAFSGSPPGRAATVARALVLPLASALALALVVTPAFSVLPAVVGFALYARIESREDAMRSTSRIRMVDHLRARGPSTVAALGRELGLDRTTVRYHVRMLARTGGVAVERRGAHVMVALPGQQFVAASATGRAQDRILETLRSAGGVVQRAQLDAALQPMPARTRNHALNQLIERGLVRREWDESGETVRLRTAPRRDAGAWAAG